MPRLHSSRLRDLPASVRRPAYEPARHGIGIVHLGLGAFHRAHQACYVDDMLALHGGDWRIAGISCRSNAPREQLLPQDCLYTVAGKAATGTDYRVVGAIADAVVAPEDPAAAIALLARPSTHLITLTITEKAYQATDAALAADRESPQRAPASAIGLLTASLRQRYRQGTAAPTLLSCDNLRDNGRALRHAVIEHARHLDPPVADWIERTVKCPSSMVDRIVPATTAADRDAAEQALQQRDEALVTTEPFTQWVIEEDFTAQRPPLDLAGAQFVRSVQPYEIAKLRLLNGSHSTLAYVGLLAHHTFVHEAIADADIGALIRRLMSAELAPTLQPLAGFDTDGYQSALLARFANPAMGHRLGQIAIDGSQKLPQRLLAPLRERLARGQSTQAICFAIAAWMRFACDHPVDDPLRDALTAAASRAGNNGAGIVRELLGIHAVFGDDLCHAASVHNSLVDHFAFISQHGVMPALRRLLGACTQ